MNHSDNFAALILAAGYSSRLGGWKPLQPLKGSNFIEVAVQRFRAAGVKDIRVIAGHRAEELSPVLSKLEVKQIYNPDYHRGMFASVRAGVRSLEPVIAAFFLLPVDIPLVKPHTIMALMQAYHRSGSLIVYPCFQGRRGHPPLISLACVAALPSDCEGGLRAFLSRYHKEALDLEVRDEAVLLDCDTPEDYRQLQAYASKEDQ
jgi:molybdenum cofactor cytidylyltransferase